jgi:CheY-like chemotaxis protein
LHVGDHPAFRLAEKSNSIQLPFHFPRVRGFEVLRQIRAKSAIPVIMRTAHGYARDRFSGGSGLSITGRAVRLRGGSVRAVNCKDGGLLIELQLPLHGKQKSETANTS